MLLNLKIKAENGGKFVTEEIFRAAKKEKTGEKREKLLINQLIFFPPSFLNSPSPFSSSLHWISFIEVLSHYVASSVQSFCILPILWISKFVDKFEFAESARNE